MLMNLLPGLRDVRTPLTVGFICAFTMWIIAGNSIPPQNKATGLVKSIYTLYAFLGKPAALAAISFLAYICGVLVSTIIEWAAFWIRAPFTPPILQFRISRMARADLASYIFSELHGVPYGRVRYGGIFESRVEDLSNPRRQAMLATERGIPSEEGRLCREIEDRLAYEQDQLRVKLLVSNPAIYTEHDRHRAEAEFRTGVGAAGAALVIALAINATPYWLAAISISVACLIAGEVKRREANDVFVQAVVAGELVPAMIGETIEQWRAFHSERPSLDPLQVTDSED
ncbi:hypothetical protein [Streptomyces sp. NBC_01465]|uniref:hypothetical protein n=1 Tax=Streptomyces sp. NBC_01465 TaxID=2903878 RepID=UPI002E36F4BC|nr:hypothetical protein [Streptomyces sp. NBC_01465]